MPDIDIFPEDQKTMIVGTQLYGKGLPISGFIFNLATNAWNVSKICVKQESRASKVICFEVESLRSQPKSTKKATQKYVQQSSISALL